MSTLACVVLAFSSFFPANVYIAIATTIVLIIDLIKYITFSIIGIDTEFVTTRIYRFIFKNPNDKTDLELVLYCVLFLIILVMINIILPESVIYDFLF